MVSVTLRYGILDYASLAIGLYGFLLSFRGQRSSACRFGRLSLALWRFAIESNRLDLRRKAWLYLLVLPTTI